MTTNDKDRAEFEAWYRKQESLPQHLPDACLAVWLAARRNTVPADEVRELCEAVDKADEHATLSDSREASQYIEIDTGLWGNVSCAAAALAAKIGGGDE